MKEGQTVTKGQKIAEWEHSNASRVQRARRTLAEIYGGDARDLATLSVAARQIRSMTRATGEASGMQAGIRTDG